jgi:outer membrane protein assembly factor BamB
MRTFLILVAGAAWLFTCQAADWPTFLGNPERTGYYPDPVGHPSGRADWKVSLGSEIVCSPVVEGGMLYIGARDSCVYAMDARNGIIQWRTRTGGWVDASPLVDGDRLIVGSRDSVIYVLDRASGAVLGRMSAGVQLSSPAKTAGGQIISGLGLAGGGLAAFRADSLVAGGAAPVWSVPLPQFTYSTPAVKGAAVVIGATDGKLYAIDAVRKDTVWSLATAGVIYRSTPAIEDTIVYFAPGDEDRNIYAVNLLSGKVLWKNDGVTLLTNPKTLAKIKAGRILTSVAELNRLAKMSPALRKKTIQNFRAQGIEVFSVPKTAMGKTAVGKAVAAPGERFVPTGGMKTSSVAVGPRNIYVIQKELGYVLINDSLVDFRQQFLIQAFDKATGVFVWSAGDWVKSPQLGYCSTPVVTDRMVFFGWGEGRAYALDADSGNTLWADTLQGHIISSPAIAEGKLYLATMDGNLYAYGLNGTAAGLDFQTSTYCYPNPAKTVSHIQYFPEKAGSVEIRIYDTAERLVKVFAGSSVPALVKGQFDWDVSRAANGAYLALVKMTYSNGTKVTKIVKIAVIKGLK